MTIERIVPTGMKRSAALENVVAGAEMAATKTTARVENTKEGMCPICHSQLLSSTANGLAVLYCPDHSLVMPVRDPAPLEMLPVNPNAMWGPDSSLC